MKPSKLKDLPKRGWCKKAAEEVDNRGPFTKHKWIARFLDGSLRGRPGKNPTQRIVEVTELRVEFGLEGTLITALQDETELWRIRTPGYFLPGDRLRLSSHEGFRFEMAVDVT